MNDLDLARIELPNVFEVLFLVDPLCAIYSFGGSKN